MKDYSSVQALYLIHFDIKEGPKIFLKAPLELRNSDIEQTLPILMNLFENDFFIHIFGDERRYRSANLIFNIPSYYIRGRKEMLLISLVVDEDSEINLNLAQGLLESFAMDLIETDEAYKAFHFNPEHYEEYSNKLIEIKSIFHTFYRNLMPTIKALSEAEHKLKASEERYKALYNNALVGMLSTTIDGKPLAVNDYGLQLLGYNSKESFMENYSALKHWVNTNDREEIMAELREKGEVYNFQTQFRNASGQQFWGETSLKFFLEEQRLDAVFIDITERKKLEEKYRELIEHIHDIIVEVSLDGTILYISPQVYDILGYRPEELIGKNSLFLIHPDELNTFKDAIEVISKTGAVLNLEYRIKHKSGDYIYVFTKGTLVKEGGKTKLVGVIRDVSDEKEAEQILRESEDKYRNLFEYSPHMIIIIDPKGKIIDVNKEALDYFGYSKERLIGKYFQETTKISSEDLGRLKEILKEVQTDGTVTPVEFEVFKANGKTTKVMIHGSLIKIEGKDLIHVHLRPIDVLNQLR